MWCLNRQSSLDNELKLLFIYVGYKGSTFQNFQQLLFPCLKTVKSYSLEKIRRTQKTEKQEIKNVHYITIWK